MQWEQEIGLSMQSVPCQVILLQCIVVDISFSQEPQARLSGRTISSVTSCSVASCLNSGFHFYLTITLHTEKSCRLASLTASLRSMTAAPDGSDLLLNNSNRFCFHLQVLDKSLPLSLKPRWVISWGHVLPALFKLSGKLLMITKLNKKISH